MGKNCMVMFRKMPLYPKLISVGDNVWIASNVLLITHDVIHRVINNCTEDTHLSEYMGCIDIKDNVFIGAGTMVLPNVTIGPNSIIAAGSVVNKSLPGNGVYGGTPAKYICSFDALVEKRKAISDIEIVKNKRKDLSEKTVEQLWDRFNKKEEKVIING